jgi:DNA repair protein RecO (recombination protein O)
VNLETVTGMVLSAMPVGEYDKRLVLLTKEAGKISAFARGARRPNSAILAASQPFAFGEFSVFRGRDSYTVSAANISNYFEELRENLEGAYYGFYFCEFADYLTRENVESVEILKLLYQSLRALAKGTIDFLLVRLIYELRLVALNGESPQVFECVHCGKQGEMHWFSTKRGGLLCEDCKEGFSDKRAGSPALWYTMQYILTSPLEKLYTFRVSEEVLMELRSLLGEYLEHYIGHSFKSLEILEIMS